MMMLVSHAVPIFHIISIYSRVLSQRTELMAGSFHCECGLLCYFIRLGY